MNFEEGVKIGRRVAGGCKIMSHLRCVMVKLKY